MDRQEGREVVQHTAVSQGLTRRGFLKYAAAAGASVSLLSGSTEGAWASTKSNSGGLQTVRWISPRGTLDVMDDYDLHVPIQMGYFKELGINVNLIAGPLSDALATTTFVAQHKADMGYPSPGVLTASLDAGVPVKGICDMAAGQVFDFALPPDSKITSVKQLAGKKIALGSAGWSTIVNPILVEVGVDPKSVKYVEAGSEWAQVTARGEADAALTWEGLRAQWLAEGLKLKYLIGTTFSNQPSNVYAVRTADLKDPAKVDLYTRFLQGVVMGLVFAQTNPRAAAQITYGILPKLRETLKPEAAYLSFLELRHMYGLAHAAGKPWGWSFPGAWKSYLQIVYKLGQTKRLWPVADAVTNALVVPANRKANVAKAIADAKAFRLNKTWQAINPAPKTY
jgi:NitT/TauT family transport system substrate-binding protein